jgi:pimeloyl-ACP methyl ester carboxylesterase
MDLNTDPRPDWLTEQVWPHPVLGLDVEGRRVAYTDTGGDGPVLLMVHVGLWSLLWGGLIGELAGRYRCVTLDVPGSGLSDAGAAGLPGAVRAIEALIGALDLREVTLVVHDLGGLAALAAAAGQTDRVAGLVAMNTFGWQPRGVLRLALRMFGSPAVRELSAWLGLLAWGSATRFGAGRRWDRVTRRSWRRGLRDRARRRFPHRMFADAARGREVPGDAEAAVAALARQPTLTVFGQLGDYFGFRRQWRARCPNLTEAVVPWGLHFPMADNPELVAEAIHAWHCAQVRPALRSPQVPGT